MQSHVLSFKRNIQNRFAWEKNTYLKKIEWPVPLFSFHVALFLSLPLCRCFFFFFSAVCKQAIYCTVCLWGEEGSGTLWTAEGATHQQGEVKVNMPLSATVNENPRQNWILFFERIVGEHNHSSQFNGIYEHGSGYLQSHTACKAAALIAFALWPRWRALPHASRCPISPQRPLKFYRICFSVQLEIVKGKQWATWKGRERRSLNVRLTVDIYDGYFGGKMRLRIERFFWQHTPSHTQAHSIRMSWKWSV